MASPAGTSANMSRRLVISVVAPASATVEEGAGSDGGEDTREDDGGE